VGPRAGLDAVLKKQSPCPCWDSNSGQPAPNTIPILTEPSRMLIIYGKW